MHSKFRGIFKFASPLRGLPVDPMKLIKAAYVCRLSEPLLGALRPKEEIPRALTRKSKPAPAMICGSPCKSL